jgi:multiple sugar transport system substrate-binding protein/putative aldouronate transport system substrate-binding protein
MKRISVLMLVMTLALCAALVSCSKKQEAKGGAPTLSPAGLTGDALAFSKFTEPVDVHIGMGVNPTLALPAGDTPADNQYTRYLRDTYNINIIVDWTAASGANYDQKVSLAIASDTLPDALIVSNQTYMLKAAQSDQLYDIGALFEQYASSQVKGIVASTGGRSIPTVSYNGKMIALPNITTASDGLHIVTVQKNWLDQYGLPVPRTLDDIENAARVFKERQPAGSQTIPIIGPDKGGKIYGHFLESSSNINSFDPVFNAYDAYPGYFLEGPNKTATYGSLDPKMKLALQRLADWYKEGLIDPELGSRDSSSEPVNGNLVGFRFGPWWSIGYGNTDSFRLDPNANWQAYPVYSADGKWNARMKTPGTVSTLISKKASPDAAAAVIIMYNALVRDEAIFDRSNAAIDWYPLRNVVAAMDETEYEYRELTKVLKGETSPESYDNPMAIYKMIYHDAQVVKSVVPGYTATRDLNVSDFSMANMGDFSRIYAMLVGNRPYSTQKLDKEVYSLTYSMTDLLEQRWANLWKMEHETMMLIITGKADISSFDKFVSDWKAQGGQAILDDIAKTFLK